MIKNASLSDLNALACLGVQLWPHQCTEALEADFGSIMAAGDSQFFLKYVGTQPVGFAQCQLRRDYVEGTESSPVGYLEGIFVLENFRRQGFARELLAACEGWAADSGCTEFASDCEISNLESFRFHMGVGFIEANRIICFTKELKEK